MRPALNVRITLAAKAEFLLNILDCHICHSSGITRSCSDTRNHIIISSDAIQQLAEQGDVAPRMSFSLFKLNLANMN